MTDIAQTIQRKYGVSPEDADTLIAMVATETMERYLATHGDELAAVHGRDQTDAALEDTSKAVARHYRTLRAEDMGEASAVQLCVAFQWLLMADEALVEDDDE